MQEIDRKEHVVVDRQPAKYKATRYVRPVWACAKCKDKIAVAEPVVTPIAKGIAGVWLLVYVLTSKYQFHLPLYRIQRQIYHESRIWFTRSTLVSWVRHASESLERIYKALLSEYRASREKHADETPFKVKADDHYRQGYMWVGVTGEWRTAVFRYDRHRSAKAAQGLLSGSSPGDHLMVDDCPSYNKPINSLKLIDQRCLVHIRRRFFDAWKAGP